MAAYADADAVIQPWVLENNLVLLTEWADRPARFVHIGGLAPFECFQISIDPPHAGQIAVCARSIDTIDDIQFDQCWEGSVERLSAMLAEAMMAVQRWRQRTRGRTQ